MFFVAKVSALKKVLSHLLYVGLAVEIVGFGVDADDLKIIIKIKVSVRKPDLSCIHSVQNVQFSNSPDFGHF